METKIFNSMRKLIYGGSGGRLNLLRYAATLLVLLSLGIGSAWGSGYGILHLTSETPAKGLVYANKDNNAPSSDNSYAASSDSESASVSNSSGSAPRDFYGWAKGARGWQWASWSIGETVSNPSNSNAGSSGTCKIKTDGAAAVFTLNGGRNTSSERLVTAKWKEDDNATITYAQTVGGSYTVNYQYVKVNTSTNKFTSVSKDYTVSPTSGDVKPSETAWDGSTDNRSYVNDKITLSTTAANLIRWEEVNVATSAVTALTPTVSGTTRSYQYQVVKDRTATIRAVFKSANLGEISGDKQISVNNLTNVYNYSLTVPVTDIIGDWVAGDFSVGFSNKNGAATFTLGSVQYTAGLLTIPFTYQANAEGNTTIDVTVSTPYGAETSCQIVATAEVIVDYEAEILLAGQTDPAAGNTGALTAMLTKANGMSGDFTLRLMNPVTITAPLSFTNSFTFDINGKTLTSTGNAAISIDAADITVRFIDGSFIKAGKVIAEKSLDGVVSAIRYTVAGKITLDGGTIIAHNTSTAAGAKAYAVNVSNDGIFFMTAGSYGRVSAEADNEAVAIYVASSTDFATMNGGVVEAQAKTNAYGVWSAGVANITDATISAETQTGTNACGVYVNGSTTTLTNTTIDVLARTTQAYGAYAKAGRLNMNGGTVVSKANSDAYGVHIAAGATASVLMGADITVSATVAGNARGLNNLGTLIANNADVHATAATTGATAVNSETNATSTTIDGGSYVATAGSGTVYGLHHQYGDLSVDGGEFHGIATGGSAAYGVRTIANGTIKNATMWGETQGVAHTAYGYVAGTAGKTTTLTKCVIKGESVAATAYAIYSRAIVEATDCELTAIANNGNRAAAFWAENGTNTIIRCNGNVMASETEAWGVNHLDGACTINGGSYTVLAKQAKASAVGDTKAYGIQNAASKTITISDATFSVTGNNTTYAQKVYGLFASGTVNCTNSTFDVKSRIDAYGVYGDGTSNLTLSGNKFEAEAITATGAYGMYSNKNFTTDNDLFSATATTTAAYALSLGSSAKGTVLNGKFAAVGTGNFGPIDRGASAANVVLKGGFYTTSTNLPYYVASECSIFMVDKSETEYAEGYRYVIAEENPARFVCYIGNKGYATLEAAMQYTIDNPSGTYTIVMSQPYTLPAGNYTLPSNASLLIPYKENQTTISTTPTRHYSAEVIAEYLRLTLASGVHWNVNGKIEVSSRMYCAESTTSYVNSAYGCMELQENSILQLNNGAKMYVWGFVIGKGDIKVKGGAEVREFFQALDLPTIGTLFDNKDNYSSLKYFPCSQYFIQNIEVPTTYYYNSKLITSMYIGYKGDPYGTDNVKLIGTPTSSSDNYLFQIVDDDESSWVRKEYNATKDRQIWTIGSKAQLGALTLTISGVPLLGSVTLNSKDYILPLTSNMTINLSEGGQVEVTQSMELLPGAEVNINKTASFVINQKDSQNETVKFYVIDSDQAYYSTKYVNYSPSWPKATRPSRSTPDAAINVYGGKIVVKGNFYTTDKADGDAATKTGGANIYSNNENAGTVSLQNAAPAAGTLSYWVSGGSKTKVIRPAQLKNKNGTYVSTTGATSGVDYGYMNDAWHSSYVNGPFTVIDNIVYAKPSEYVQLKTQQTGTNGKLEGVAESNHTYLTIADKILILQGKGTDAAPYEWWEVVATATSGVFECQKAGYEGFYSYNTTAGEWQIVKRNVTFYMDEAKTESTKKVVSVNYMGVPDQSVISSNPTKGITTGYTYTFYGWKSSVTNTEYAWTETLETAENDMYYTPVFTPTKRNYTITLNNAYNGETVYLEVPYEDTPEYTPRKDATAQYTYTFNGWSPAFAAVTGTATYTAQWTSVTNRYTITWKNGDETLETDKSQAYGTVTSYNGATPTKEMDDDYVYTFSGWLNSLTGNMRVDNETVTGAITYTAQFSTTPRYMITFANYDGTQLQKEPVTQDEHPIYKGLSTPARARDKDGYYTFTGWKRNSTGVDYAPNATLPAATQKETYTAQYSYTNDLFTITLHNVDGNGATWSGKFGEGSTPFYNPNNNDIPVIPEKVGNVQYSYSFTGWSLTNGGAKLDPVPAVTGPAEYWALFAQTTNEYNITFANIDGFGASQTIQVEYGATPVCPVTPTKEQGINSYAFTGWNKTIVAVTGEETYTATFSSTPTVRKYDITFNPANGGASQVHQVTHGDTPAWEGANPTKAQDAQYTYTFAGWDPTPYPVDGEESYIATYSQTVNSYTVTFKNYDGTVLDTKEWQYGSTPSYSGTPSREFDEANAKFYTFNGWSPVIGSVTGNVTYTAQFNEDALVATVTTTGGNVTPYSSWLDAFNAANSNSTGGCTIKLYKDAADANNTSRPISKNMTIDLNGHTLSSKRTNTSSAYFFYINSAVSLTVDDSKGGGKIYYEGTSNTTYNAIYVNNTGGSVIVNGGTIQAHATYNNSNYYASAIMLYGSNSRLTLNDGELIGSHGTSTRKAYAVRFRGNSYGYANINGGKLKVMAGGSTTATNVAIFLNSAANRTTLSGGYYSKDPGNNVTIATDYEKVNINNATEDPEYSNGYTYKVIPQRYALTWNVNGGDALVGTYTSGSVSWGTAIVKPTDPTRTGYTFAGWNTTPAATMPKANTTYTAQWSPNTNTPYVVKHYKQALDRSYSETPDETENLQGTTDANVTPETKNYTGFTAPSTQTQAIAADGSMVIEYQYTRNSYELTWDANGGTIAGEYTSGDVLFEAQIIAPDAANVTRAGYEFAGWNAMPATMMPAEQLTYTAQWLIDADLVVAEGDPVDISNDEEVTTTTVQTGAQLTVDEGKTLSTKTFVIEAISEVTDTDDAQEHAQSGSGEVTGNIEADVMYFDLKLNNPSNRRWNAFTVPFVVDLKESSGHPIQINGETLTLGRGYDIIYYNGATRAAQGPVAACWEYVEDPAPNGGDSILYPGKAYMIASASRAIQTVRFTKATDSSILSRYDGKVSVAENATDITTGNNGGWNGIGNPRMYHTVMNAGAAVCQVHDGGLIGADGYRTYDMDGRKLVVGKAVFVQVDSNNNNVSVVQATGQDAIRPQTNAAPRRTLEQIKQDRYDVQIAAAGYAPADRLIVLAEEDKEDKYVILKDLSKAGVSPVRAQMWVDRYGEKLCMNTTALINNKADYPLTISAPKAGEYDIFLNNQPKEGTILYLTYDGRAIWNLTYGGYTATLEKGLDTHYGLRVVISKTPTGLEEATIENGDAVRKVIVDDKVFIIRNGEIYSVTGQKAQ